MLVADCAVLRETRLLTCQFLVFASDVEFDCQWWRRSGECLTRSTVSVTGNRVHLAGNTTQDCNAVAVYVAQGQFAVAVVRSCLCGSSGRGPSCKSFLADILQEDRWAGVTSVILCIKTVDCSMLAYGSFCIHTCVSTSHLKCCSSGVEWENTQ